MVPLCSYGRVERLQGAAFTSSHPSTAWTACLIGTSLVIWLCRPPVLLSCRALVAEPEYVLVASQPDFVRQVPLLCIVFMVPLCQQDRVLCNGWLLDPPCSPCRFSALRAASLAFADMGRDSCTPFMATSITVPASVLIVQVGSVKALNQVASD